MNLDVKEKLEAPILDVPNFPKEGIMFKDITPLLAEPGAISEVATQMASAFEGKNINYVAGLEARGFIIGPSVANILNAALSQSENLASYRGQRLRLRISLNMGQRP